MGFFKDLLPAAIGGVAGFFVGGPAGALTGASIGLSYSAAREQAKALRAAGDEVGAAELERMARFKELTDAGIDVTKLIREDLDREPGTSPLLQLGLQRGTENIMRSLAPFGLTDSSTAGRAVSDFATGLAAQDIEDVRRNRLNLAQVTLGAGSNLTGHAVPLTQQRAGLLTESPRAGLLTDLATSAAGLGFSGLFNQTSPTPTTKGLRRDYHVGGVFA